MTSEQIDVEKREREVHSWRRRPRRLQRDRCITWSARPIGSAMDRRSRCTRRGSITPALLHASPSPIVPLPLLRSHMRSVVSAVRCDFSIVHFCSSACTIAWNKRKKTKREKKKGKRRFWWTRATIKQVRESLSRELTLRRICDPRISELLLSRGVWLFLKLGGFAVSVDECSCQVTGQLARSALRTMNWARHRSASVSVFCSGLISV